MTPIAPSPSGTSVSGNGLFFPPGQATPDHIMLAARKQQLAHLQNLQRQQQQMLQQMTPRTHSMNPASMTNVGYEERNDRFTGGMMRSPALSNRSVTSLSAHFSNANASNQPVFECDYDSNPTELYLAVQKKDWDAAVAIASDYPHEASTWVSRKESDGKLRWRLLPLHAAIIFKAPEKAVSALLGAFAHGAACKDDQGMLPLHLAFRNGCDEKVVEMLLTAYPQSVDVQDRKGRTPMDLAQSSNHPNREAYIRALEKGPAYYAAASAAKEATGASAPLTEEERNNIEAMRAKVDALTAEHTEKVAELEAELTKTQETSQVLVDHVNSLEAQLASRSDTERFLATKIANLDASLKTTTAALEEKEAEFTAFTAEKEEKDAELTARVEAAETENAELKEALESKLGEERKVYALTNKERIQYDERIEKCERDVASFRSEAQMLEEQLKKKIEIEHSLASQVSMLAAQLASSATDSTEATESYQRKCEGLEKENADLKSQIAKLENKLSTVASALDAMATEQERIVNAATRHEQTMANAAASHLRIMNDTARQESLLEDAAKEREQIVAILMRQAEDAERTMGDRERILDAVREQEESMMAAAEERDLVVQSVNKQREYMDFVMNGELSFLKMTKSEEEQEEEVEKRMTEMESKKEQYLASTFDDAEEEATDDADKIEGDDEVTKSPSQIEAELRAQIAIEEAMLAKLKADTAEEETEEVLETEESVPVEEKVVDIEEPSPVEESEVAATEVQQVVEEETEVATHVSATVEEDSNNWVPLDDASVKKDGASVKDDVSVKSESVAGSVAGSAAESRKSIDP
eukprot:scaffold15119_cov63-Cyclotella_meneghiniana.AAC.6